MSAVLSDTHAIIGDSEELEAWLEENGVAFGDDDPDDMGLDGLCLGELEREYRDGAIGSDNYGETEAERRAYLEPWRTPL